MRLVVSLLCASHLLPLVISQREHKVHNIVLYPHKHSWCKTTAIKQVVAYPGCDSLEVENNVCVGGCFSYSIPRTIPSSPGEVVPYCDSCQPSTHSWKQVVLNCSSGEYEGKQLTKMVQLIDNCTCTKCSEQAAALPPELPPLPSDEPLPDKPQLMDIMESSQMDHAFGNYTILSNTSHSSNDTLINQRTLVLLGELSEGDEGEVTGDQVALKEILHHVEGDDHKINGVILKDFVDKVEQQGHINIDVDRLQRVLEKLEHAENSKSHHRHQHMLMGPHHSLVFPQEAAHTPEMFLKPTLDVPSHLLKPAHEGSELSYHNNLLPIDPADSDTDSAETE